ncbi:MAG: CNNM domain-containing protein [Planctomycetota bacterium]|nr:CNNM domain-containing protein [Planctomycetota bacterium]
MTTLLLVVTLTLFISFLCSLLEATLLSVSLASLEERSNQGRGIRWLLELKRDRLNQAISAILILNTISNTMGASFAGYLVAQDYPTWLALFSALFTFLILTGAEIIPKTLGAIHSRKLSGFVGIVLQLLTILLKPLLILTGSLTRLLGRSKAENVSRGEVEALIGMASTEGTLEDHEERLYLNILRLDEILVGDMMTPRTVVWDLWQNATVGDLLAENKRSQLPSRIPIYAKTRDDVIGYILLREVLTASIGGLEETTPLSHFRRDIRFVPEVATLRQALSDLTSGQDPIAMVADEHGGTCGLLSTEDLFETILGIEVVDEHDHLIDLRDMAQRLREQRLTRLEDARAFRSSADDSDPNQGNE